MAILRTPDERFRDLPGYPFEPRYVDIGGLRMQSCPSEAAFARLAAPDPRSEPVSLAERSALLPQGSAPAA